jgi:hypothetical protein
MLTEQYPFLDSPTEESLLRLIEDGVAESHLVDFKQDLPKASDTKDKREFLADVTAFANAGGGMIVYGMRAEGGRAAELCGISCADADHEAARLKDTIHGNVEPALLGLRFVPVKLNSGRAALVVQVPGSWNSPHMITEGSRVNSRFWIRVSNGKQCMDVDGLRSAFLHTRDEHDELRRFRDERLGKILARETPVPLLPGPAVVVHLLVPGRSASSALPDLMAVGRDHVAMLSLSPEGSRAMMFCMDGLLAIGGYDGRATGRYALLFRSGSAEQVWRVEPYRDASLNVDSFAIGAAERYVLEGAAGLLKLATKLNLQTPVFLAISVTGVRGSHVTVERGQRMPDTPLFPLERDVLVLPDLRVDDLGRDVARMLQPVFDMMWNAWGYPRSLYYDEQGNRKRF